MSRVDTFCTALPIGLRGDDVLVDSTMVDFSDGDLATLLVQVLLVREASSIVFLGPAPSFESRLQSVAADLGLSDRIFTC